MITQIDVGLKWSVRPM